MFQRFTLTSLTAAVALAFVITSMLPTPLGGPTAAFAAGPEKEKPKPRGHTINVPQLEQGPKHYKEKGMKPAGGSTGGATQSQKSVCPPRC